MKRSPITDAVCLFIRRLRQSRGLSSTEAARRAGIPLGSYSCIERGHYRLNLEALFRILAALGADIRDVWPWECTRPMQKVTERFVEEASKARPRCASMDDLLGAVCEACGLAEADLASRSQDRRIVEARHVAALVLVQDCRHLKLADLARRLNLVPSALASRVVERMEERSRESGPLKARIEQVRQRLAELAGERVSSEFLFEGEEAARAFAEFLNGELAGVLADTEGTEPHLVKATQAQCSGSSVQVACSEELSGVYELCWLAFSAAWPGSRPAARRSGVAVRLLLQGVAGARQRVGCGNGAGGGGRP